MARAGRHASRRESGVVACGYADGYPRVAPDGTPVAVDGKRVALVGRVSMDMITVDLSQVPTARVGSQVELWGDVVPIDEVAERAGTVGYELMCALAHARPAARDRLSRQARSMAKAKTQYVCSECGGTSLRWQGQCPALQRLEHARRGTRRGTVRQSHSPPWRRRPPVQTLGDVHARELPRLVTGIEEFDRALGGGLVEGGVVLIGGDPGIGKSTLLLQALARCPHGIACCT